MLKSKSKTLAILSAATALVIFPMAGYGEVSLPGVFSDNMVLQQGAPLKIWGQAEPGENVAVSLDPDRAETKADAAGKWEVSLPARKASAVPARLVIQGRNEVVFNNILVGEVWLCSGQSNMSIGLFATENADQEVASADHPLLRLFISPQNPTTPPRWKVCTPATVLEDGELHAGSPRWKGFSAVGYYFGKELQARLGIPVGMIQAAAGGSSIQVWIAPSGGLYKSMVQPLVPFPIRGVVWYQGEANNAEPRHYLQMSGEWIEGWRAAWNAPEMPFYITQIAPHQGAGDTHPFIYPEFWETQFDIARKFPHVGIVGTTDLADIKDIHPKRKREVGQRLALQALQKTYGKEDIVADGPAFKALTVEGFRMRVSFDHVPTGLKSRDGKELNWFEIIDADQGHFVPAHAEIDGKTVVLSSPEVKHPIAVRFGWHKMAEPNLISSEGLPAYPFRAGEPNFWRVFQALENP